MIATLLLVAVLDHTPAPGTKIDPWLDARLGAAPEPFLVLLDTPEGLAGARRGAATPGEVRDRLVARARTLQEGTRRFLAARGVDARPLWIAGALQVRGDRDLALALAGRPEVLRIVGDPAVPGLLGTEAVGTDGLEWGVLAVHADQAWAQGVRGEGITVASADTGVDWTHPAILAKYRGWDGDSADHRHAWHDAIQDLPVPLDDHGHGTHTVGTMVGDDGAGNQVGVAPGARWIGCRNMDHGVGRPSTYLECNQWFLAPWPAGGDPEIDGRPDLAPHVVNNSWGCPPSEGCDPGVLAESFRALRSAGILAVAAAGNAGPFCSTVSDPPAIYDEPLVAGATNASTALALFSSRGPVTVDGSGRLRPDLVAPGESVRSSVPGGGYSTMSGTSMASPHASGVAALLWSGKPQVRGLLRITECLLTRSANPVVRNPFQRACGGTDLPTRPNNMTGWGLVDAAAALAFGPDGDADGIADACDCAASDGGAYDPAPEARGVAFAADKATLSWDSLSRQAGPGTVYDLLRGALSDLAADGGIARASCLAAGIAQTAHADAVPPAPGDGAYYLVQGRNGCGAGGYGTDSTGSPRTHAPCP